MMLARLVHVGAVLLWIGGVAFVTTVIFPAIRGSTARHQRLAAFHRIEGRFASQARWWVALAGASGLWMCWRADMWNRFADAHFLWMHAMVLVWVLFAAMLFVIEPLFLHLRMAHSRAPAVDFARMERMHRLLLAASMATFLGAVGGSHGFF